ncbi:probable 8-oxoguanine-DNA-glycosylase [Cyanidioschyzon merolae strain 10D]|jgi:N-glycosylase/DNA lyase|uniref:DNA-(apurinic or apyrimidinic site) lyase n=1 Tax=Cyanidioschyzon merolae (strain NIES-3377 / 10D) TaxID=280699 RepID=M1V5K6_CYAM1|nr:probable 8-oxoguanine-DNA-glycosylase [Cyanidioschyzon merolae strain 10D]BAM80835.1 probable 8-oxoguanine-DNA-glycosylase [Cyanidioschyzon merolae strain 10D]|eukprot:XP_005536871.1 probable 8-oxoguanine-DNA-glycosylase [Cyanidioschyzon merolae strain 10D]
MTRKRVEATVGFATTIISASVVRSESKLRAKRRLSKIALALRGSVASLGEAGPPHKTCFSPWYAIAVPVEELDLPLCLEAGQTFRWKQRENGLWCGVHAELAWNLYRPDATTLRYCYAPATVDPVRARLVLQDFLRLSDDAPSLVSLYEDWSSSDPHFRSVAPFFQGTRVLRQDPVECLFSFLCSSNNHIRRISGMVEFLARRYGRAIGSVPAGLADDEYYAFPSVAELAAQASVAELRANGFGYRAEFVVNTAKELESRGGNSYLRGLRSRENKDEVIRELVTLPGVGRKVASCIALLSLDCAHEVPVDTHVWQLTLRHYAPDWRTKSLTEKRHEEIGALFRERFGPLCGWAHQVLFIADLDAFQDRLPEALRAERTLARKRTRAAISARKPATPPAQRSE